MHTLRPLAVIGRSWPTWWVRQEQSAPGNLLDGSTASIHGSQYCQLPVFPKLETQVEAFGDAKGYKMTDNAFFHPEQLVSIASNELK